VTDFVIVTAPKPAESRASISPPVAVLEIAPANVLHGAVRLHGFASSPTPDTHVRVACACVIDARASMNTAAASMFSVIRNLFIVGLLLRLWGEYVLMTIQCRQNDIMRQCGKRAKREVSTQLPHEMAEGFYVQMGQRVNLFSAKIS
jgi:hypothetical protein